MKTRIKHPTIKDAAYIAESVISRMEHSAGDAVVYTILYTTSFFPRKYMNSLIV